MMSNTSKLFIGILVVSLLGATGIYFYTVSPTKAPSAMTNDSVDAPENATVYKIDPSRSKATFTLNELLRGEPKVVIGTTSDVSGQVAVDRDDVDGAKLGTIRINARTFVTDSEQRNNAIRRMVLKTDDEANEFIEFTAKRLERLPSRVDNGKDFSFAAVGDLKISGVTKEVTFEGKARFTSDTDLTGAVETMVHYPDFGVTVPNLPFLANVDQDVKLRLDFVATSGEISEAPPAQPVREITMTGCSPKALMISEPSANAAITFPFTVKATVDNGSNPACRWTVFEAQAASMEVKTASGEIVGRGLLTTSGDWMTTATTTFEGTIQIAPSASATPSGELTLILTEDDPSGMKTPQTITVPLSVK
jgi:polyisoprenoid-binding protein YceI